MWLAEGVDLPKSSGSSLLKYSQDTKYWVLGFNVYPTVFYIGLWVSMTPNVSQVSNFRIGKFILYYHTWF